MRVIANANPCEFNNPYDMDEDKEIWLLDRDPQQDLLNNDSIFFEDFPALLDFPCMSSSSSSSSSIHAPITCSSSSSSAISSSSNAASWAADDQNPQASPVDPYSGNEGVDCMDVNVMENFGCMDLLDEPNDVFDPSSVFARDESGFQQHPDPVVVNNEQEEGGSEDLAHVFLEWLKKNKESISAEDLRSVKIKKSTIAFAAKRLGGGKEAMKQLLKLILEWVQTNHLQKRKRHGHGHEPSSSTSSSIPPTPQSNPSSITSQQQPSNYMTDPGPAGYGCVGTGDPFVNPPVPDSAHSWTPSQFNYYNSSGVGGDGSLLSPNFSGYPYQYLPEQGGAGSTSNDESLVRLGSSATKEARKKRMARLRRFLSHNKINYNNNQGGGGGGNRTGHFG